MFPGIDIQFQNKQLGQVVSLPDGVSGLIASATAVGGTFLLNTSYMVKSMIDVAALGIIPSVDNYVLYKALKEFYAEAGDGTELWLMGFAKTTKVSDWFTLDVGTGKAPVDKLIDDANGKLRFLWSAFSPTGAYVVTIEDGIDEDVWVAQNLAQQLAERVTEKIYAPFHVILEGYAYNGNKVTLKDLSEMTFNRTQIMLGDSEKRTGAPASKGATTGTFAGRNAKVAVHVNPGKVADGPTANLKAYILDTPVENYDTESLHDKGYVTFRTHTSKSGYYFVDSPMACEVADDYHYSTNRRVIDKAYRLTYQALLDFLLAENTVQSNGTLDPIYANVIENNVENLIYTQMTSNGELSYNPTDKSDRGVICKMDLTHNVTSTSKLKVKTLQVRARGTNRWFDVPLGFVPVTSN